LIDFYTRVVDHKLYHTHLNFLQIFDVCGILAFLIKASSNL
jgi:hypothetical protein